MLRADILAIPRNVTRMTHAELMRLPEYSTSLPTGTQIGKRWRRDGLFMARRTVGHLHFFDGTPEAEAWGTEWYIGEYVASNEEGYVDISWSRVEVVP
jgi:hypothetical protein